MGLLASGIFILVLYLLGTYRLCSIIFTLKDGIGTKAVISDIQEETYYYLFMERHYFISKYNATINYVTKKGLKIESPYSSRGGYLGKLKRNFDYEVDVEYSESNPYRFRLPGDKGHIILLWLMISVGSAIMIPTVMQAILFFSFLLR